MKVIIGKDYQEISRIAGSIVSSVVKENPNAVLGLATGSTPIGMYQNLVKMYEEGKLDFSKVRSVNLDEYYPITPDNDQSYRYFMNYNLFDHVNIDKANTSVPDGTVKDVEAHCKAYEEHIDELGGIDIQVLGMGRNGHIGFNEPFTPFDSKTRVVDLTDNTIKDNARFFDSPKSVPTRAITMGISEIMSAKRIILLASGLNKAQAVFDAINGALDTKCPASVLTKHANCTFILDKQSASML